MITKLRSLFFIAIVGLLPALTVTQVFADPMAPIEDKQGHTGTIVTGGEEYVYGYADPDPSSEREQSLTPGWKVEILNSTRGSDGRIWYRVRPPNDVTTWVPESQVSWD